MIIAIDGPAAAGKTTLARLLAEKLGFLYLDTGATYRAAAYCVIQKGIDCDNESKCSKLIARCKINLENSEDGSLSVSLDGKDITMQIRTDEVSEMSSRISVHEGVRAVLVDLQRRIAEGRDVVAEGRDTGSVVFPDANLKIYLDANMEIRAERRLDELTAMGVETNFEAVMNELTTRDKRDMNRKNSPLLCLPEAIYINNARMTVEETLEAVLKLIPQ